MANWYDELLKSPGFCTRPFFHAYISQSGGTNVCCNNTEYTYGNINEPSFDEIISKDNNRLTDFRRQFINSDQLPNSCRACRDPVRDLYRRQHVKQTGKFLSQFNNVEELINNEKLYTYDIRFNNLCNIQCSYCNPQGSSRIAAKFYKKGQTKEILQSISENNIQQILDRFEKSIKHVAEFYFAGGEPLIMKEHYQILDLCLKHNNTNIILSYNSNMTKLGTKKYNLLDYWSKFRDIRLNASVDAGWDQFEFIRDGAVWTRVLENFRKLRSLTNVSLTLTPTVAFWNMIGFPKVYKYLVENDLLDRHHTPFGGEIQRFEFLRPAVLPKQFKDYIIELYHTEYKDYPELQVLLSHLNEDVSNLLPRTKQHVEMLAAKKGLDFYSIFPEFKGIFDNV